MDKLNLSKARAGATQMHSPAASRWVSGEPRKDVTLERFIALARIDLATFAVALLCGTHEWLALIRRRRAPRRWLW